MNIVFGGAFNPPSIAHYKMLEILEARNDVENIIVLPVGNSYNKKSLVSQDHRYNMIKIMASKMKKTVISLVEFDSIFCGTYESLNKLSSIYDDIVYVIGADNLINLDSWLNFEGLMLNYRFITFSRDDIDVKEIISKKFLKWKKKFIIIKEKIHASSSLIRSDVNKYKEFLLPEIYEYIISNKLYIKE